jgi:large subunit ribosomal protein L18
MPNKVTGKATGRLRRARKTRAKIKQLSLPRLSVYRTPQHIYAQIIYPDGTVKACSSTLDEEIKKEIAYGGNVKAAEVVGKFIAVRAKKFDIERVAFDRSGFKYHGRVAALAKAAREHGLEF